MLGGIVWLADRTSTLSPDFLTEVVLFALSATNVTMLVALVFVLARNVIKSIIEGRRGLPFGRFRAKLVLALLGMTVIPAVLVLIVGSRVVLTAVDRWFNAPMEEILSGANSIAGDYYQERERLVADQASRLARSLSRIDLGDRRRRDGAEHRHARGDRAAHRHGAGLSRGARAEQPIDVVSLVDVASPSMPQGWARALGRSAGGTRRQRRRSRAEHRGADGRRRRC